MRSHKIFAIIYETDAGFGFDLLQPGTLAEQITNYDNVYVATTHIGQDWKEFYTAFDNGENAALCQWYPNNRMVQTFRTKREAAAVGGDILVWIKDDSGYNGYDLEDYEELAGNTNPCTLEDLAILKTLC